MIPFVKKDPRTTIHAQTPPSSSSSIRGRKRAVVGVVRPKGNPGTCALLPLCVSMWEQEQGDAVIELWSMTGDSNWQDE